MTKTIITLLFSFILVANAKASFHPLQISLCPPYQIVNQEKSITGVRLNLIKGKNKSLIGFDFGGYNQIDEKMIGISVGIMNDAGYPTGCQFGLLNVAGTGNLYGIQTGGLNIAMGFYGLQIGLFNGGAIYDGKSIGGQFGLFNGTPFLLGGQIGGMNNAEYASGIQLGIVNFSEKINGVQIGLVNISGNLNGVQIGLINFADNAKLKWLPLLNASF